MEGALLHVLVAAALAAGVDAAPAEIAIVRMVPADVAGSLAPGMNDDVLMVPLDGGPVAVADDAEAEGEEDPWAVISGWLGLDETTAAPAAPAAPAPASDEGPLKYFSSIQSAQSQSDGDGDGVVLLRVARGLKSVQDAYDEQGPESRVLEEEDDVKGGSPLADEDVQDVQDEKDAVEERMHRRTRRALRLVVRQAAQDGGQEPGGGDGVPAPGRADAPSPAPPAAPGTFLETVQNQLPGQLQGLGGAMEDSRMIVGSFQAIIMPGSAATDLGQQIQGFISNMPQVPQLPAGGG